MNSWHSRKPNIFAGAEQSTLFEDVDSSRQKLAGILVIAAWHRSIGVQTKEGGNTVVADKAIGVRGCENKESLRQSNTFRAPLGQILMLDPQAGDGSPPG